MSGIDDIKSNLRRRRESAFVLIDQSPIDRFNEAERRLAAAVARDDSLGVSPEVAAAQLAVDEASAAITDAEVEFVFEGMGRQGWTELVHEHPPTPQEKALDPELVFGEAFTLVAISKTCVSRELTVEDAEFLYENLDEGEFAKLWGACLTANFGAMMRPKSVAASALRPMSALSWLTAGRAESLDPSSSDVL